MTARNEHAELVRKALNNSARNANIADDDDSEDIGQLIAEYFITPGDEEDSDASEGEEESDDEDGESARNEFEDEELVNVEAPSIQADIQDNVNLNPDAELVKVQAFDCKCKMIKCVSSSTSSSACSSVIGASGCESGIGKRGCISQFSDEEVMARRMDMAEFTEAEKDMILLGILASTPMNTSDMTAVKPCRQKKRQHQRTSYIIDSKMVCRETFKFNMGISQNKLTALLKHYLENGVTPRRKKWGGRKFNTNALTSDDTERVVSFLRHFAEDHALVLPGRVPGFKRADVKILPSSETKAAIWRHYRTIAIARGHRALGKSSFFNIWKQHIPFIVVGRPMTDLCFMCKQNNNRIRRSVYLPEEERLQILGGQMQHLKVVEDERKYYKTMVNDSKAVVAAAGVNHLGPHPPNSLEARFHYSFDFAQQGHLPSSPLQPGPIYFLVPRKCGIFGVCAEGLPQQINYLIDEGMCSGKGSNMVISLLHHFFSTFGLGEKDMDLHCDNCSGQNKNRFVLWYMAWRTMRGLHTNITINFMPAGHTKFSPDWCFGLLKRRFKISEAHCLNDLCHVVSTSTRKGINRAQLVGSEGGEVYVPVYDWQSYFDSWFRPLKGIKSNHHFRFSAETPGTVFYKHELDDPEVAFDLAFDAQTVQARLTHMPAVVPPPGLSAARQEYLRNQIRPFVRPGVQDRLCP